MIVYWRIYTITKHHSRQRLKDTQRMDETLCQIAKGYAMKEIAQNGHKLTDATINSEDFVPAAEFQVFAICVQS